MSDPAKSPEEIEDVLASIRRLVSDHNPAADKTDAAPAPTLETGGADVERLVLTPSFRVAEPDEAGTETDEGTETEEDTEALIADLVHSEDATEAESAPTETAEENANWQPDDRLSEYDAVGETSEDDDTVDAADADPHTNEDTDDAEAELDEAAEVDAPQAEPEAEEYVAMSGLSDLGGMEDVDPAAQGFESETGDEEWPEAGAEAALLSLVAARDGARGEDTAQDAPEPEAVETGAEEIASGAEDTPTETSEGDDAMRTPVFSRRAVFSHATDQDDASLETSDEASEAPSGEDTDAEDLGEDPNPFTFPDGEDGILDEETLREIIVDVVREELQGVLGQRITRNVRKMVRREIRMALAAEDLD